MHCTVLTLLFLGKPITKQSDIYAYAIVLWELATSELPYNHLDDTEQIAAMVTGNELRPKVQDAPNGPFSRGQIPLTYTQMMQLCWHQQPGTRPTMQVQYCTRPTMQVQHCTRPTMQVQHCTVLYSPYCTHTAPTMQAVVELIRWLLHGKSWGRPEPSLVNTKGQVIDAESIGGGGNTRMGSGSTAIHSGSATQGGGMGGRSSSRSTNSRSRPGSLSVTTGNANASGKKSSGKMSTGAEGKEEGKEQEEGEEVEEGATEQVSISGQVSPRVRWAADDPTDVLMAGKGAAGEAMRLGDDSAEWVCELCAHRNSVDDKECVDCYAFRDDPDGAASAAGAAGLHMGLLSSSPSEPSHMSILDPHTRASGQLPLHEYSRGANGYSRVLPLKNLPPTELPENRVDPRFLRKKRGGSRDDETLQGANKGGFKMVNNRALVRARSWGPMTARRKLGSLPPVLEERTRMIASA
jgi:hypothetical protein